MDLTHLSSVWTYWGVLVAAIVEGEIAYIAAAALVAEGHLNPVAVVAAGSLGAAIGDQLFFYALRGRLSRWMARYPSLERKTAPLVERVRRHEALMVLLIRFAPGLRIAIASACAWVNVPPLKFSVLSLVSAIVWAIGLIVLVGTFGPAFLARFGLGGWRGAVLLGVVVLVLFKVLGSYEERALDRGDAG